MGSGPQRSPLGQGHLDVVARQQRSVRELKFKHLLFILFILILGAWRVGQDVIDAPFLTWLWQTIKNNMNVSKSLTESCTNKPKPLENFNTLLQHKTPKSEIIHEDWFPPEVISVIDPDVVTFTMTICQGGNFCLSPAFQVCSNHTVVLHRFLCRKSARYICFLCETLLNKTEGHPKYAGVAWIQADCFWHCDFL